MAGVLAARKQHWVCTFSYYTAAMLTLASSAWDTSCVWRLLLIARSVSTPQWWNNGNVFPKIRQNKIFVNIVGIRWNDHQPNTHLEHTTYLLLISSLYVLSNFSISVKRYWASFFFFFFWCHTTNSWMEMPVVSAIWCAVLWLSCRLEPKSSIRPRLGTAMQLPTLFTVLD